MSISKCWILWSLWIRGKLKHLKPENMDVSEFPWPFQCSFTGNAFLIICYSISVGTIWNDFRGRNVPERAHGNYYIAKLRFRCITFKGRQNGATRPGNTLETTWEKWCTTKVRKVIGEMVGKMASKGRQEKGSAKWLAESSAKWLVKWRRNCNSVVHGNSEAST